MQSVSEPRLDAPRGYAPDGSPVRLGPTTRRPRRPCKHIGVPGQQCEWSVLDAKSRVRARNGPHDGEFREGPPVLLPLRAEGCFTTGSSHVSNAPSWRMLFEVVIHFCLREARRIEVIARLYGTAGHLGLIYEADKPGGPMGLVSRAVEVPRGDTPGTGDRWHGAYQTPTLGPRCGYRRARPQRSEV